MSTSIHAAVVISGTRVIYPADEREVSVKVTNEGTAPVLVQSWIDDGNANALPEDVRVPFTLTPPLFRLDPAKGQTLRIIYTHEELPADRESLFWLNVLEVPSVNSIKDGAVSELQIAFRSRIKVFVRPKNLTGNAKDAAEKLVWWLARRPDGSYVLRADNLTPYHVTISKAKVHIGESVYPNKSGGMVIPGSSLDFPVAGAPSVKDGEAIEVEYTYINDFGAGIAGSSHVSLD